MKKNGISLVFSSAALSALFLLSGFLTSRAEASLKKVIIDRLEVGQVSSPDFPATYIFSKSGPAVKTFDEAQSYCGNLGTSTRGKWRLPYEEDFWMIANLVTADTDRDSDFLEQSAFKVLQNPDSVPPYLSIGMVLWSQGHEPQNFHHGFSGFSSSRPNIYAGTDLATIFLNSSGFPVTTAFKLSAPREALEQYLSKPDIRIPRISDGDIFELLPKELEPFCVFSTR